MSVKAPEGERDALERGARGLGLELDELQAERLLAHLHRLVEWNRVFNLTAVKSVPEMIERHVLDCLAAAPYLAEGALLDVGTGAGFPGMVLAVLDPARQCILLDSGGKKTRFCRQVAAELGLGNVSVVQARAESFEPPVPLGTVATRAFADLARLVALAGMLLPPDGRLVALKGPRAREEVAALDSQVQGAVSIHPITIPGSDAQRCVVTIDGLGTRLR